MQQGLQKNANICMIIISIHFLLILLDEIYFDWYNI